MIEKKFQTGKVISLSKCIQIYYEIICNSFNGFSFYSMNATNDGENISIVCTGDKKAADWKIILPEGRQSQRIDHIAQKEADSMIANKTAKTIPYTHMAYPFVTNILLYIKKKEGIYTVRLESDRNIDRIGKDLEKLLT